MSVARFPWGIGLSLLLCAGCYRIHDGSDDDVPWWTDSGGEGGGGRPGTDSGSERIDDTVSGDPAGSSTGLLGTDTRVKDTHSVKGTEPNADTATLTEIDPVFDTDLEGQLLARDLLIEGISLFQGVEIVLMKRGEGDNPRNAAVVAGRDAMLRIYLSLGEDWEERFVWAAVEIESSTCSRVLSDLVVVSGDSRRDDLATTGNIDIPGECLSGDLTYRVSLLEVDAVERGGDAGSARWPVEDEPMAALEEDSVDGVLQVVIIPVVYDADDSGRLPDTSDAQLEEYREHFWRYYPIPNDGVEITVGEPMHSDQTLDTEGGGWDEMLREVLELRDARDPSPKVYYFGLVAPAETQEEYCPEKCIIGTAYVQSAPGNHNGLAATGLGIGFSGGMSARNMLHLVGVNHGRGNAPACGAEDMYPDPEYPYERGLIGVWGYDLATGKLKDPEVYTDLMGFCDNPWISDYTYDALFDFIQENNTLKRGVLKRGVFPSFSAPVVRSYR